MIPGKKYTVDDIVRILLRRRWLVVLPFAAATIVTVAALHWIPNRYRSETLILVVPQRVPETYVKATVTTKIGDRLQSITQQILSRTRLERIIQDFNLYVRERRDGVMENIVEQMRKDIAVQMVKGDAFRVSYVTADPQMAMKVTERLASLFIEQNLRDRELLADATNQFLDTQLEDARRRLEEHEHALEEYRKKFSGELPSQLQSNLQVLQSAQLQLQALAESMNRDRDQLMVAERSIAASSQPGADEIQSADPASADEASAASATPAARLEASRATLRALETRLTDMHPDVIRVKRLIADLEQKVAETPVADAPTEAAGAVNRATATRLKRLHDLQTDRDVLRRQIDENQAHQDQLQHQITGYQTRVAAAPARESEIAALSRDYDTLRKVYAELLAKREDSKVAANLERRQIGEQFKILDPAQFPEKPFSPNRPLLAAGGAGLGLFLGLALIALMEHRDRRLRTEADVALVLQLPVLALIPRAATPSQLRRARILMWASSVTAGALVVAVVLGAYLSVASRL
jgi:polysaccharide chain length determinant protein (PEP-CTERM system associated)